MVVKLLNVDNAECILYIFNYFVKFCNYLLHLPLAVT